MLRYSIDEWKKYHIKIEANVIDKRKTDIRQYTYFLIGENVLLLWKEEWLLNEISSEGT